MSCKYCRYYREKQSVCARYPEHIKTDENHYCGELSVQYPYWIKHLEESRDFYKTQENIEREKRLNLEKKIKALRIKNRKLMELKK
jgi:Fe-S-cluster containining protein